MKISDLVINYLADYGVKYIFTLPGGFSMHLNDSANFHPKLKTIYCLHESDAGFAACGYAAYTGKLGVCLVTSAPGSTNALTACLSAYQDSLPVLFLSGEAKTQNIISRRNYELRQGGAQDVEIEKIVEPMTKYAKTVVYKDDVLMQLETCVKLATTPRKGSTWLAIPLDIQEQNG